MANLSIGGAPRIWGLVDLLGIKSLHFHKSPLYNSHSFAPSAVFFGEGSYIHCHMGSVGVQAISMEV